MTLPGFIFFVGALIAIVGATYRVHQWRRGRDGEGVSMLAALMSIPRRYFHDVHDVVVRDASAARMHVFAAGGFVAAAGLILIVHVLGIQPSWLVVLTLITTLIMGIGAIMAGLRRFQARPGRLSSGLYDLLPLALGGFALFYFWGSWSLLTGSGDSPWLSPMGFLLMVAGIFGTAFLVPGLTMGPMRHAFAGAMHLAFHPRPSRFADDIATGVKPLDLDADQLGITTPEDFTWQQRLSFDACVQCGRCEEVCPAFAAGAPLNPKKLIFDLWATGVGDPVGTSYAGHPYPGQETREEATLAPDIPIIDRVGGIPSDTLWSCTTCRACVEECPMMIEHVDAIIDLRRFETLEKGATPPKAADALETLAYTDTMAGKALSGRLDWAADLDLPLARDRQKFDVLVWLGDSSFDPRGQRTLTALLQVLRSANIDFAVLGEEERDVGDLARRLGDEAEFQRLAHLNISTLARYQFNRIVTNDPHVLHSLRNEYPAFGGRYEVTHHTTYLNELVKKRQLVLAPSAKSKAVTYHDPCYLGRYNKEYEAPRALLDALSVDRKEMERSGSRSFCCGWGGGAVVTDIPSKARIPDLRMEQAKQTGADLVAVACPNCTTMLEGVADDPMDVVDIVELVAGAIIAPATREEA